ncbi:metallophosphoesterase [Planctomycetota bacterium]
MASRKTAVLGVFLVFVPLVGCARDFVNAPYLQRPGRNEMTIMWSSRQPHAFRLEYGEGTALTEKRDVEALDPAKAVPPDTLYRIRLTGLRPGTTYRYVVASDRSREEGTFRTVPAASEPFSFIAYGDSRTQIDRHESIASCFLQHNPAFIIHTGDMVTTGAFGEWQPEFFGPLEKVLRHVPLWPARGNHDGGAVYAKMFELPDGKTHYSFDYANAHFVCLDMNKSKNVLDWLEKDLASSTATWKFVFYHYPTYDAGAHRSGWGRGDLVPVLRGNRVDFALAGHSHGYQRFRPLVGEGEKEKHPITFMVVAGGGAPLHRVEQDPHVAAAWHKYHYVRFDIDGDTLSMKALTADGEVLDSLRLTKKNGQFDEAYLAQAMPESTFGQLRNAIAPFFGGMVFPELLTPDAFVPLTFPLGAGEYGMKFRVWLEERAQAGYEMTPVEGTVAAGKVTDVTISVRTRKDTARPGTLWPILRLMCEYEIDGKKGKIYSGRLRCPEPIVEPGEKEE